MTDCSHLANHPENTEWPADVALDHFLHCLTPDQQLAMWRGIQQMAGAGTRCTLGDHQRVIASQARYTAKLLTGVREVLDDKYSGLKAWHWDRLKGLIS